MWLNSIYACGFLTVTLILSALVSSGLPSASIALILPSIICP